MRDADDVVYWLQERALRRYGATMNAAHTETQEWLWADEITRLREENARLREALAEAHEVLHKLTAIIPGNDTAGEEVSRILRAAAAIREGGT